MTKSTENILQNPNAFATPLLLYAFEEIGMDIFDYEPESIRELLKSKDRRVTQAMVNRVNAAVGLFTSDLFWQDPTTFAMVCYTLNRHTHLDNGIPDFSDICWGITEARLITGDFEESEEEFSPAVLKYIKYLRKEAGLTQYPEALEFLPDEGPEADIELDDPLMSVSRDERQSADLAQEDYLVRQKMVTCLTQISLLNIPISEEAAEQLEEMLKDEDQ